MKITEDRFAFGFLIAFAVWIFVVLPFYYGPRDDNAANKCSTKENENYGFWEKARCDPVAYFTAWLVGFTGVLALSTIGLWIVTRQAVKETRRIGEAQVRAYVSIKSATVDFLTEFASSPRVLFVAANSGQSPARNFIWNITLQYAGAVNRETAFNEKWLESTGLDIPANGETPPNGALVPNMPMKDVRINVGVAGTIVRLKMDFRYTDVFDRDWFGEAFFAGVIFEPQAGTLAAQIFPMERPSDCDEIPKRQTA